MPVKGSELKKFFEKSGLTAEAFARHMGINRSTLYRLFEVDKLPRKREVAFERIRNPKANAEYVMPALPKAADGGAAPIAQTAPAPIPVYDVDVSAGNLEQYFDTREFVRGYIDLPSFSGCVAFVQVRGDSMYPKFMRGDLIGLKPVTGNIIHYGQPYMIVTRDNERLIKYVRKGKTPDSLVLKSENEHFEDIDIPRKDILKWFAVKGPIRDDWQ
jgi:phage repressor protein C with HTH and peptisase S24 domain